MHNFDSYVWQGLKPSPPPGYTLLYVSLSPPVSWLQPSFLFDGFRRHKLSSKPPLSYTIRLHVAGCRRNFYWFFCGGMKILHALMFVLDLQKYDSRVDWWFRFVFWPFSEFLVFVLIWVFPKIGVPQNGWFIKWKTLLKWMIWGYHYFRKHPYHRATIFATCLGTCPPLSWSMGPLTNVNHKSIWLFLVPIQGGR